MKHDADHIKDSLEGVLNNLTHDYRQGKLYCSQITIQKNENDFQVKNFYGFIPSELINKKIEYKSTIMGEGKNKCMQLQEINIQDNGEVKHSIISHMLLDDNFNPIHPNGKMKYNNP